MFEVEKGAFVKQFILAIHRYKCSCVCVVGCELRFAICDLLQTPKQFEG